MNYKELIEKLLKGEKLTDAQAKYVADYKGEEESANKKAKDKLAEEKAKRETAEKENTEMKAKLEEIENKGLSDVEKLQRENDLLKTQKEAITAERDQHSQKIAAVTREIKIAAIAKEKNYIDAKYLDFVFKTGEIDIEDSSAVEVFMTGQKEATPNLFKSSAVPGSNSQKSTENLAVGQARLDELHSKSQKESLNRKEAVEVIELQEQLTKK